MNSKISGGMSLVSEKKYCASDKEMDADLTLWVKGLRSLKQGLSAVDKLDSDELRECFENAGERYEVENLFHLVPPPFDIDKRTQQEQNFKMSKPAFQPRVVSETYYRVEVPWSEIGGWRFPAVETLFRSGIIERQAWRVADYVHYCIFYFRSEDDAEKFVKAIGGYRLD